MIGLTVRSPLGLEALRSTGVVFLVFGLTIMVGGLFGVASLFARRRSADATTREQLRWLVYVVGAAAAWIVVGLPIAGAMQSEVGYEVFWVVATPLVAPRHPDRHRVAIVRYRLFDIDVVINRALVFGALAAVHHGVYVAIVVGIGGLIGSGGQPGLSNLGDRIVAVAFQPVRARVQRLAEPARLREARDPVRGAVASSRERMAATSPPRRSSRGWRGCSREGTGATAARSG